MRHDEMVQELRRSAFALRREGEYDAAKGTDAIADELERLQRIVKDLSLLCVRALRNLTKGHTSSAATLLEHAKRIATESGSFSILRE